MRILVILLSSILASATPFAASSSAAQGSIVYECSMHPEVQSSRPGKCPKCNMNLVARKESGAKDAAASQSYPTAQTREVVPQADAYTCSMHPEVRTASAGSCPKCGMALVPVSPEVTDYYDLKVECSPALPKPNERVRLRFAVINPKTGEQVKQFQLLHEKLFHLFIVSQDMNEFQHIHPIFEADGRFTVETVFPRAGSYKVYSDFYPSDGTPQVLQHNLATAGQTPDLLQSEPKLLPDTSLVKIGAATRITQENASQIGVDATALQKASPNEIKVELTLDPQHIIAGQPVSLKYHLTDAKTGEPVRDIAPYLGAWGHTLILSQDQSDYVHSHPEQIVPAGSEGQKLKGGPDVTFEALIPRPGNYRIWTQFLRGDMLTTVSFTVRAERLR